MRRLPAIILARGGSKGIPNKNLVDFCGRPLINWTIEFAGRCSEVDGIWVSTDDSAIAEHARAMGAEVIIRPSQLATDLASSEVAWVHATSFIRERGAWAESFIALQPTSPLRVPGDISSALDLFWESSLDTVFSGSVMDDVTLWELRNDKLSPVNHNVALREPRQHGPIPVIENGSLYILRSQILAQTLSRFAGKVGFSRNEMWQFAEIDSWESHKVCEALMRAFVLSG